MSVDSRRAAATLERPDPRRRVTPAQVAELLGPVGASFALIWLIFTVADVHAAFGFGVCWLLSFFALYAALMWRLHGKLGMKDRLAAVYVVAAGLLAMAPLIQIIWTVVSKGAPVVFSHFPHFLTTSSINAGATDPVSKSGVAQAIVGTLEEAGVATVVTVPIAVLTATYLTESSGAFTKVVRTVVDSMTGTPSIIAGLFVYLVWVEPRHTAGKSGLAASMALIVLMLPIVTRTAEEVIRIVPGSLREASLALGAPQWRTVLRVILPAARAGLATAVILGVARGIGETAPVLFTAGGAESMNANPFKGSQGNLPLQIFNWISSSSVNGVREGWGGAFVLVFMVLSLFVLARLLGSSKPGRRRRSRAKELSPS